MIKPAFIACAFVLLPAATSAEDDVSSIEDIATVEALARACPGNTNDMQKAAQGSIFARAERDHATVKGIAAQVDQEVPDLVHQFSEAPPEILNVLCMSVRNLMTANMAGARQHSRN